MAIPALPKSAVDEENALSIVGIDKAELESLIASGVFAPPTNGVWLPEDIRKLRCLLEYLLTIDEASQLVAPLGVTKGHCAAVNYEVQITNAEMLTAFLSGILPCSSIDSAALVLFLK
jgi:hypothetical protein